MDVTECIDFKPWVLNPSLWTSTGLQPVENQAMQASQASSAHAWDIGNVQNYPAIASLWKNCFPQNQSLVSKRLGASALNHLLL